VAPEVAIAVSRSQAEALAQLGERLATIQLLRDGLYRACEGFANGAISDTTYAVILSRYDDTMITMLLGEFAAGAFGRSLAALGTGAEGKALASLDLTTKQETSRQAEAKLTSSEQRQKQLEQKLEKAEAASDPKVAADLQCELERESKNTEAAKSDLIDALKAEATSASKALNVVAAGGITPSHAADVPKTLHEMQRKYLENLNFDALEVACLSALDRPL
jgi:hypothetical protein